jgi:amidase
VFRIIQAAEAWANHGAWVESARPKLSSGVAERLRIGSAVTEAALKAARERRAEIAAALDDLLVDNAVMLLPSAAGIAPRRDSSEAERDARRAQTLCITSIAGLGGLPQVSLPLAEQGGCPLGLSLMAARGNDAMLLRLAVEVGSSGS